MRIDEKELAILKGKHKGLHLVTFNDENTEGYDADYPSADFVFKKLSFDVLAATAATANDKPIQAIKAQMQSTLVFGDERILFDKDDITVLTSVMSEYTKINKNRVSELKKI